MTEPAPKKVESIYNKLSKPLPKEAFHSFTKEETGLDYEVTGHNYQYVINRLNEVVGVGNWKVSEQDNMQSRESGVWEVSTRVIIEIGKWENSVFVKTAEVYNYGGGKSKVLADAHKAALTNGIKKAAAMLGIGKETYELSLDSDFVETLKDNKFEVKKGEETEFTRLQNEIKEALTIAALEKIRKEIEASRKLSNSTKAELTKYYNKQVEEIR